MLQMHFGFDLVDKYSNHMLAIEHVIIDRNIHWVYSPAVLPAELAVPASTLLC